MKRNTRTPCPNCHGYPTGQDEDGHWYSCYTCGDTGWLTTSRYAVSYDIVTEDSVINGDAAERGWIDPACDSLRDAIKDVTGTRTNEVDGVECTYAERAYNGLTLTIHNSAEFRTGDRESRTLHVICTRASAGRIARLLNVRLEG